MPELEINRPQWHHWLRSYKSIELISVFCAILCSSRDTQQCNITVSAVVTPQLLTAIHWRRFKWISQAYVIQLILISIQQFTVWFLYISKGNHNNSGTNRILFLQVTAYVAYSKSKYTFNEKILTFRRLTSTIVDVPHR